MDKHTELREKLEELKQPKTEPRLNCWKAEKQSDGTVAVIVSEEFENKQFVLVEDVLDYFNYPKTTGK